MPTPQVTACGRRGRALGLQPSPPFHAAQVDLARGDHLVFATDGLLDATRPGDESFYADLRLVPVLEERASASARDLAAAILDDLLKFRTDAPLADDLALLVVERHEDAPSARRSPPPSPARRK